MFKSFALDDKQLATPHTPFSEHNVGMHESGAEPCAFGSQARGQEHQLASKLQQTFSSVFSKDFSEEQPSYFYKEESKVSDFAATGFKQQVSSFAPVAELEKRATTDKLRGISPDNVYDRGSSPSLEADGYESADSGSSILNEIPCHRIEETNGADFGAAELNEEDEFQSTLSSPSSK